MFNIKYLEKDIEDMKVVNVFYSNGFRANNTYLKRAKGLVKNNKAKWIDDNSIMMLDDQLSSNSVYTQLAFWYRNINYNNLNDFNKDYFNLLENIYKDFKRFEVDAIDELETKGGYNVNNLKNYQVFTNFLDLIYAISLIGKVSKYDGASVLVVDKELLKSFFKGNIKESLNLFSFYYLEYLFIKEELEIDNLTKADKIYVYSLKSDSLIVAISNIAKSINSIKIERDNAYKRFLFYTGDFIKENIDVSLLDERILKTINSTNNNWKIIVDKYQEIEGFNYTISIHPYVSPYYSILFFNKNKKIISFRILPDKILMFSHESFENSKRSLNSCMTCLGAGATEGIKKCGKMMVEVSSLEEEVLINLI